MLSDIITPRNNQTYNVWLAHKIGLNNAIFLSVVMDLYFIEKQNKALQDDRYFYINQDYIYDRTTYSYADQDKCCSTLISMGFIELKSINQIAINFDTIACVSTTTDSSVIDSVEKIKKNAHKESKTTYVLRNVKSKINPRYPGSVQQALRDWLDAIAQKFNFVNYALLESAQTFLNPIVWSDVRKAEEIIKICTANGYREMEWGLNKYNLLHKVNAVNKVSTTVNVSSEAVPLTDEFF